MGKIARYGGGAVALLLVLLVAFAIGGGSEDCAPDSGPGGDGGTLSATGKDEIPKKAAEMYKAMADKWDLDVAFLASIGRQESDHGRNPASKVINGSGCIGWMQLGVGGACGDYWGRNKCDGNGDGKLDVLEPLDNICASAKGLRKEKGAPPAGGPESGYHRAACNYYGACGDSVADYANQVMARAKRYGFESGNKTAELVNVSDTGDTAQCDAPGDDGAGGSLADGQDGDVTWLPNANRPGVPVTADMQKVARKIAGYYGHRIVVCTGTSHSRLSASGNVSDHWAGNGIDICSSQNGFPVSGGGMGDLIAAAAFRVAGQSEAQALASGKRGGAVTLTHAGLRFQIIWKSDVGGNHYNHIHVGVKRVVSTQQARALPGSFGHDYELPA
jgi:hypothetical protein